MISNRMNIKHSLFMVAPTTRKSWVDIPDDCDFSLDNIPFGVCSFPMELESSATARSALPVLSPDVPRCCTAIGDYAVDLHLLAEAGLLDDLSLGSSSDETSRFHPRIVFSQPTLNSFMACSKISGLQNRLIALFIESNGGSEVEGLIPDSRLRNNLPLRNLSMHPFSSVTCHLPASIGDYTDFYSSREHATNVGIMFRGKDNALQPNWLHMPIGYHGRSSTIFPSGSGGKMATIRRPCGQLQIDANDPMKGSTYGPCKLMDFELEVAFFVGGTPNYDSSNDRIFGYVLMNDWSARDIQKWEYVPLGPLTSKNFATTISPWVVTPMALEPFRCETSAARQGDGGFDDLPGSCGDPVPLEYLRDPNYGSYDVNLSVSLRPSASPGKHTQICQSNLKNMYWSSTQQLVHHSVTGCLMNPGDLLASGTISGKEQHSFGSMLELSWKGSRDVVLDGGEVRKFLKDGDAVIMRGWCKKDSCDRVGFGECSARVLPANPFPYDYHDCVRLDSNQKTDQRFTKFKLHGSIKSSFTRQVCIALSVKGISYETEHENSSAKEVLVDDAMKNPMYHMPSLEFLDRRQAVEITQSLPIIEFLEASFPDQGGRLFPVEPLTLVKVKEVAAILNSPVHPFGGAEEYFEKEAMKKRLSLVEDILSQYHSPLHDNVVGSFAFGLFGPTLADVCIVPQLQDARVLGIELEKICPVLLSIEKVCNQNPWFR
ncbi:LOW QUALITY PROTEIN: hypothetical protein HJC23_007109 [Cyclotella cryptica]|uniref:fumarylacetoacetase n=1 Tax=Cyclotella cryptica TaxID=29204 RepID=A0ABD3P235_9STRA